MWILPKLCDECRTLPNEPYLFIPFQLTLSGLPMTHSLHVFDTLELKSPPSSLSCACSWHSKFATYGWFYSLELCTAPQLEKMGTFFVSNLLQWRIGHAQIRIRIRRHRYHHPAWLWHWYQCHAVSSGIYPTFSSALIFWF